MMVPTVSERPKLRHYLRPACGALATSLRPFGPQPRSGVIFVLTQVSSMNTRRDGSASCCHLLKVYRDQGVSGAKSRQDRPAFDALCKDASRRQFDLIAAWSVDRLGRSLQDLVGFLTEIHALGVNLFLHQQGVDTTTPAARPYSR
jgi:hypothetical protein